MATVPPPPVTVIVVSDLMSVAGKEKLIRDAKKEKRDPLNCHKEKDPDQGRDKSFGVWHKRP